MLELILLLTVEILSVELHQDELAFGDDLVESDCIQGEGTLGMQAAAALRSEEEQKEQEKGSSGETEVAWRMAAAITPDSGSPFLKNISQKLFHIIHKDLFLPFHGAL